MDLFKYVKLIFKVQQHVEESRRWSATVSNYTEAFNQEWVAEYT